MRPYRVLLVSHYYPPHLGGIENVVRQEALHLAALGVEVTVLTSGERAGTETADGVRVVRVAAWNGVERRTGVPFPVLSPALLGSALRWARWADAVHLHDCLYPTSWAAGAAAALTRTPHLVTQHVGLVEHPSALVRGVQRAVYAVAGRPLLRRARRVLTLNASVADFVRRHGARTERVEHLPNGVDTALFRPTESASARASARARFGLPAGRVLVLFAGRLVPKKGFQLLLDAHSPADGYELVFAGDGDSAALRGRAGVHHLGTLAPEALAEAYRACDVFALPSTAEGFPLTVQEAMASGLPVVTTDDPGYAPYRLDREQVRLVPRQVDALRTALADLAADEPLRARMGRYSLDCARTSFDWTQHARRLLTHYQDSRG
ncbi:glycosyltransferase family 4 protein [Kitasatospora sp. NBC_01266]|uniref:glycosyltransferase family 4 protein n=1 Tax=Kitasatospora sp. NBC_01266 TaxID=2903572 RepID=UPI002E32BE8A|nr:glycosyltransferase family 4 protein [Kitasatospora sp. NBC_01266]